MLVLVQGSCDCEEISYLHDIYIYVFFISTISKLFLATAKSKWSKSSKQ